MSEAMSQTCTSSHATLCTSGRTTVMHKRPHYCYAQAAAVLLCTTAALLLCTSGRTAVMHKPPHCCYAQAALLLCKRMCFIQSSAVQCNAMNIDIITSKNNKFLLQGWPLLAHWQNWAAHRGDTQETPIVPPNSPTLNVLPLLQLLTLYYLEKYKEIDTKLVKSENKYIYVFDSNKWYQLRNYEVNHWRRTQSRRAEVRSTKSDSSNANNL